MATFGPQAASGASDDATVGTVTWSNPGNVTASDDTRATAILTGGLTSHYLKITFDLSSLPSYSSLDGVQVAVECSKSGAGTVTESSVKSVKNGTIGGNDKSAARTLSATPDTVLNYGAVNDTWGQTFANGDTIGVALSYVGVGLAVANVDYATLTLTYSVATATSTAAIIFFSILFIAVRLALPAVMAERFLRFLLQTVIPSEERSETIGAKAVLLCQ